MNIETFISDAVRRSVEALYGELGDEQLQIQKTRREFEGDYTLVTFPLLRRSRKSPEATATEIGEYMAANVPEIASFNVIKGFLNLSLDSAFWAARFAEVAAEEELRGALVDAIEIRRRDRLEELPHDDRILRDRPQDVVRLFKAGIDIRTEAARPGGLVDMVVQRVYLHSHDTSGRRRLPDDPVLVFLVVGHLLLILEVCILLRLRCSITSFVVDSKAS